MTASFNRKQREELNELSLKLFGVSSKWQKMLKNKSYWVPTGETQTTESKNYFISAKGPAGNTLMSVEKAVATGRLPAEDANGKAHPFKYETTRQVMRAPTYEEMKQNLTHMVDSKSVSLLMSRGNPEDVRSLYAYRFVKGDLRYSFGLQKTLNIPDEDKGDPVKFQKATAEAQEAYDKDLNSLLETIEDETLIERINDAVIPAEEFKKIGGFEALDFVSEVVFCLKQPDNAEEQYQEIMEEAQSLLLEA